MSLRTLSLRTLSLHISPGGVLALAGITLAALAAAPAQAAGPNLVTNGDFEDGSFFGFTQSGNTTDTSVATTGGGGYVPHSGKDFALLGPVGSDGMLSQTITTTLGHQYQVGFFLDNSGLPANDFSASFGGTTGFSQAPFAQTNGYVNESFTVTATGTSEPLVFSFRDDPNALALDDISVVDVTPPAVPEASTTVSFGLLLALGLGGLVAAKRKKAKA